MGFAPLQGIRVLDFSWNVAGPTATKVLAALGADVIKLEWPGRADPGRGLSFSPFDEAIFDSSGFFASLNSGKRSFTADPTSPAGHALIEELLGGCDVIAESYSPRVLSGWGWTFERLRQLNPGLTYLSVSGFGHTGPERSYVAYGPTAQAASGVTSTSGEPEQPPAGWGYSFLDVMTGYQAALAVVAALHRRRGTGTGERVDMAQVEVGAAMIGPMLLDCAVNGTRFAGTRFPPGNRARWPGSSSDPHRYESGAPYNLYPTNDAGHNGFCAITVLEESEWQALRAVMGDPDWARDARYASAAARLANQDELDMQIGEWTRRFGKYELMYRLQAAGVRSGAMQSGRDRLESDPSLDAREVFQRATHEVVGEHRFESLPIQVNGRPLRLPAIWPVLGRDTEAILSGVLGRTSAQIQALSTAGVVWPEPVPRPVYRSAPGLAAAGRPVIPPGPAATDPTELPLEGVRVIELDDGLAYYAGKLLSDLGATVVKVEPPAGCAQRRVPPFADGVDDGEHSLAFWHYNTGKQSVIVDDADPADVQRLRGLIGSSDIVLDGLGPDGLTGRGLTDSVLAEIRPGLVRVAVTPFGLTGPWRDLRSSDLVAMSLGGVTAQTGYDSANGRPGQPITPVGGQPQHFAGVLAATAVIAALQQPRTAGVTTLDIAIHDSIAVSTESGVTMWEFGKTEAYRHTGRHASAPFTNPPWQFRCLDGAYVCALTLYLNDRRFAALINLFDSGGFHHDLNDPRFATMKLREPVMAEIVEAISAFCREHTADYVFDEAQRRALPWAKVRYPEEVATDRHLHERGFFTDVEVAPGQVVAFPGVPWQGLPSRFSAGDGRRLRAPHLGEDTATSAAPADEAPVPTR